MCLYVDVVTGHETRKGTVRREKEFLGEVRGTVGNRIAFKAELGLPKGGKGPTGGEWGG